MNGTEIGRHLSDSELLRCLDEEATASERARWERHISECSHCSHQLEAIEEDGRLVREWLERAAFEEAAPAAEGATIARTARTARIARLASPDGRSRLAPWLRAAAVLALLAAPVAAIPTLRGWVVERVTRPGVAPETSAATTGIGEGTIVRFVPDSGEFQVVFDPDASGALTIGTSADDAAVLRSSGTGPEATVSPSQLRIRRSGAGDYVLRVPESITSVRVRIGERSVSVLVGEIRRGTVIELGQVIELEDGTPR